MTLPDKVRTALNADSEDMISWSILLNFFSNEQSELSLPEKITIYDKCEAFRIFWNTDHVEITETVRNSGEVVKQKKIRTSLNIDKNEVYPNNIYTDKELLDHFQTETQTRNFQLNILTTDSDRDTDSIGEAPALAI